MIDALVRLSIQSPSEQQKQAILSYVDKLGVCILPSSKRDRTYRTNHCQSQLPHGCSFESCALPSDISATNIDQMASLGAQYWVDAMQDSEMHTATITDAHAKHFLLTSLVTLGLSMEVPDMPGAFPVPLPGSKYAKRVLVGWANGA